MGKNGLRGEFQKAIGDPKHGYIDLHGYGKEGNVKLSESCLIQEMSKAFYKLHVELPHLIPVAR